MKLVGLSESGVWTRVRLEWTRVRLESSQTRPLTESMDPDPTRVHTPDSSPFETAAPVESNDRVHGLESTDSSRTRVLILDSVSSPELCCNLLAPSMVWVFEYGLGLQYPSKVLSIDCITYLLSVRDRRLHLWLVGGFGQSGRL